MQHNPSTPAQAGADSTCPPAPAPPDWPALAAHLKQTCLDWPDYGLPFCRALDSALARLESGATWQRISPTHYRVWSAAPGDPGYSVSLGSCRCPLVDPWCYHRALVHLVIALPEGSRDGA